MNKISVVAAIVGTVAVALSGCAYLNGDARRLDKDQKSVSVSNTLQTWTKTEYVFGEGNLPFRFTCKPSNTPYSFTVRVLTDALFHDHSATEELFRRVTLNVLERNRDDHLKNFGFLMDAEGHWSLAPFYDFTYSDGPNGWQTLSVAGVGENPTEADLDRLAKEIEL